MGNDKTTCVVFAQATFMGMIITITDLNGGILGCINPRMLGVGPDNVRDEEATNKVAKWAVQFMNKREFEKARIKFRCEENEKKIIKKIFEEAGIKVGK